jgi:hypothetical protein
MFFLLTLSVRRSSLFFLFSSLSLPTSAFPSVYIFGRLVSKLLSVTNCDDPYSSTLISLLVCNFLITNSSKPSALQKIVIIYWQDTRAKTQHIPWWVFLALIAQITGKCSVISNLLLVLRSTSRLESKSNPGIGFLMLWDQWFVTPRILSTGLISTAAMYIYNRNETFCKKNMFQKVPLKT